MMNVGIVGCGYVGGALKVWLEENNPTTKILVQDPDKGMNDDLSTADVIFLSLHIPTEDDGTQDLHLTTEIIKNLPDAPIFIRSTILPGTSERLSKETGHRVYFMPEFLTERTGYTFKDIIPTVENNFHRITLVNDAKTERLTIDFGIHILNHETGAEADFDNLVIIELKRDGRMHSPILALLRQLRIKPSGFSKYCIGSAITNDGLKINRFKKRLHRYEKIKGK